MIPRGPTGPPGELPLHRGRAAAAGMVPTLPGLETLSLGRKCLGRGDGELVTLVNMYSIYNDLIIHG